MAGSGNAEWRTATCARVTSWSATADGKHVLARLNSKEIKYYEVGKSDDAKTVPLAGLMTTRVPAQEWHEIFREVWRRYTDEDQQVDLAATLTRLSMSQSTVDTGFTHVAGLQEQITFWGRTPSSVNNV